MHWRRRISLATNPEVLSKTIETGGENLLSGLTNLLNDLERGKGRLSVTMTDMNAFRLGENIATTPGALWLTDMVNAGPGNQ